MTTQYTIRELIEYYDARLVSGNDVPVPDARLLAEHWPLMRAALIAAKKPAPWEMTGEGRAFLEGRR